MIAFETSQIIREQWKYDALLYGKATANNLAQERVDRSLRMNKSVVSVITGEKMVPVLYCDIDGTIRHGYDELGRFVNTAEDVKVFDGVTELLLGYKRLGWRIVGVSNQGGIALGHMSWADCLGAMNETYQQTRGAFDKILWCSHHPDADTPEMQTCWCRKPKPGLVIEGAMALADMHKDEIYPPHMGLMVGDRPEDAQCAENAGLKFLNATAWRSGHHLRYLTAGS